MAHLNSSPIHHRCTPALTKMKARLGLSSAFFISTLAILTGCTTPLSNTDRYRELEGDTKILFLDAYPDLTSQQKYEYLETPLLIPRLVPSDNLKSEFSTQRRKPLSLQIEPSYSAPLAEGTFIDFRAYVKYSDGKYIDVTSDVVWSALPPIVKFTTNQLRFECVNSDISVSASFYDEINATQVIPIKKPIDKIAIQVAESSSIIDNSAFIKLNSRAVCKDGTVSEVSCQSLWTVDQRWGNFMGCGQLIPSAKSWKEGAATVSVSYGTQAVTRKIYLPTRTPRR